MVQRWDIITIGNLSRNRYWGERDDQAYRSAICTSVLITGNDYLLLVDPSLKEEAAMEAELFRRTGKHLSDVDTVFITHPHGDHHFGLKHFPHARWLAASPVAQVLNQSGEYDRVVEGVHDTLLDDFQILHTPGHTEHHFSLLFEWEGQQVALAADAAVTRDYWQDRQGYFNSTDFTAAAETMDRLAELADIVIPGHDNYFYV